MINELQKKVSKLDYTLLPFSVFLLGLSKEELEGVVKVFQHGRKKYEKYGWRLMDNAREIVLAATWRHHQALRGNSDSIDAESTLPHRYHLLANIAMLLDLETME